MDELVPYLVGVPIGLGCLGYLYWLAVASACRTFWKFFDFDARYASGDDSTQVDRKIFRLLAGLFGALVGFGFWWIVPVLEYRTSGPHGQLPIGEKFSTFHRELHQWITVTIRPTSQSVLLHRKLSQPGTQMIFRMLEGENPLPLHHRKGSTRKPPE